MLSRVHTRQFPADVAKAVKRNVQRCPDEVSATSNCIFVNPADELGNCTFVEAGPFVFSVQTHPAVPFGNVALNIVQREILCRGELRSFHPPKQLSLVDKVYGRVTRIRGESRPVELQAEEIIQQLLKTCKNQVLTMGQHIVFELDMGNYKLVVEQLIIDVNGKSVDTVRGLLADNTAFIFTNEGGSPITIAGQKVNVFKDLAFEEVEPAFGASTEALESYHTHVNSCFETLEQKLTMLMRKVRNSDKIPLLSVVLEGPEGSGKSTLAATTAIKSGFPYVKVISSETMVCFSEQAKARQINKVFEDAYKSPLSVVILDDIERLVEYVAIGPRFSNKILQTLLVLVKRKPPPGHNLFIIGTTSMSDVMESMELNKVFKVSLHVPVLRVDEMDKVVPIKKLLPLARSEQALHDLL